MRHFFTVCLSGLMGGAKIGGSLGSIYGIFIFLDGLPDLWVAVMSFFASIAFGSSVGGSIGLVSGMGFGLITFYYRDWVRFMTWAGSLFGALIGGSWAVAVSANVQGVLMIAGWSGLFGLLAGRIAKKTYDARMQGSTFMM